MRTQPVAATEVAAALVKFVRLRRASQLKSGETLENQRRLNAIPARDQSLAATAGGGNGVESIALGSLIIDGFLEGRQVA